MYLGDAANLSYLHMFRLIVESISGLSGFTADPRKESIVETVVSLPAKIKLPCALPDERTAEALIDSFFINVREICSPSGGILVLICSIDARLYRAFRQGHILSRAS